MKIIQSILLLLTTALIVSAQTPGSAPTPAPTVTVAKAQPSAEQKARLMQLAQAYEKEARETQSAKDQYLIALLAIQGELGLKPSQTSVTWNEKGEPVFQHVEQKTAKGPPPAKPEAKP